MQIIIDIKSQIVDALNNENEWTALLLAELQDIINNGTPLPKGHGRLIEDTPELERELWTYTRYTGIDEAPYESAVKVIDESPTIIAACTLADADGGDAE